MRLQQGAKQNTRYTASESHFFFTHSHKSTISHSPVRPWTPTTTILQKALRVQQQTRIERQDRQQANRNPILSYTHTHILIHIPVRPLTPTATAPCIAWPAIISPSAPQLFSRRGLIPKPFLVLIVKEEEEEEEGRHQWRWLGRQVRGT